MKLDLICLTSEMKFERTIFEKDLQQNGQTFEVFLKIICNEKVSSLNINIIIINFKLFLEVSSYIISRALFVRCLKKQVLQSTCI